MIPAAGMPDAFRRTPAVLNDAAFTLQCRLDPVLNQFRDAPPSSQVTKEHAELHFPPAEGRFRADRRLKGA